MSFALPLMQAAKIHSHDDPFLRAITAVNNEISGQRVRVRLDIENLDFLLPYLKITATGRCSSRKWSPRPNCTEARLSGLGPSTSRSDRRGPRLRKCGCLSMHKYFHG
jgi:hypothetical protein